MSWEGTARAAASRISTAAIGALGCFFAVHAADTATPSPPDISAQAASAPAVVLEHSETWTPDPFHSTRTIKKRVRINSAAGEKYANQTIWYGGERGDTHRMKLLSFSGRTIGPDGVAVEIPADLRQDVVTAQQGKHEQRELKFTFPAVQPGAVLEWEYTLDREEQLPWPWWEVQEDIPVLESRFVARTKSVLGDPHEVRGYARSRIDPYCAPREAREEAGFHVSEFVCRNVPAFRAESLSPPENDVRLRLMFTWTSTDKLWGGNAWGSFEPEFWARVSRMLDGRSQVRRLAKETLGRGGSAGERVERLALFLRRNVTVDESGWTGFEGHEGQAASVDEVLERRRGLPGEVALLAFAMAQELGLRPYLIQAVDRSESTFRGDLPDYSAASEWMIQIADKSGTWTINPGCRRCDTAVPEWRFTGGKYSGFMHQQPQKVYEGWQTLPADIPEISPDRNSEVRTERVVVQVSGAAAVSGRVVWDGQPEQERRDAWAPLSAAARQERFLETEPGVLAKPTVTITDPDGLDAPLTADYAYDLEALAEKAEGKLVLRPRDVVVSRLSPPIEEDRRLPLWWRRPFSVRAEITFVAPAGFSVRRLPSDVAEQAPGMRFEAKWSPGAGPNEIRWTARGALERTKLPVSDYAAVRTFALAIKRAMQQQLVLEQNP